MSKLFLGIDPGKSGFLTLMNEDQTSIKSWEMPLIGKEYNIQELSRLLKGVKGVYCTVEDVYCVMEDVHAIFGASANSTWEFGYGIGILEGLLTAYNIPYSKVAPKKWQKEMFEGVPMITKPSSTGKTQKTDNKSMATIAAQRIFPNIDLRATERSKKPHDGKVDSILICEYARRNFK